MKEFSFNFFFPTQIGSRQEHTIRTEGTSPGVAFARAWRTLKKDPKYKGRKGLDNFRVGVVQLREWVAGGSEASESA